jgi:hypothetical protein
MQAWDVSTASDTCTGAPPPTSILSLMCFPVLQGCDISAWAGSSVASALRRVQSLALRNISVSGPAFFTELARVCKHLHTLILDKVRALAG